MLLGHAGWKPSWKPGCSLHMQDGHGPGRRLEGCTLLSLVLCSLLVSEQEPEKGAREWRRREGDRWSAEGKVFSREPRCGWGAAAIPPVSWPPGDFGEVVRVETHPKMLPVSGPFLSLYS